jgi:hypothetical protein
MSAEAINDALEKIHKIATEIISSNSLDKATEKRVEEIVSISRYKFNVSK